MRLLAIDFVGCAFFGTKKGNQDRAWVDMRLHESHEEGGFGVSNNAITCHAASYTTNARFVAFLGTFARPAQQVCTHMRTIPFISIWVETVSIYGWEQ
jgi:hypothetical protein